MLTLKIINYTTHEVSERVLDFSQQTCGECMIGRTPGCGLLLNSPEVSRIHARILYRNGQYFFTDLGSTDGSRLNHEMLLPSQDILLHPDDLIRICDFLLVVESIEMDEQAGNSLKEQQQISQDMEVHCVQIIDETSDVKTFRFAAESGQTFDYLPGQFVTLQLNINGQKVLRSYSISSTPSRPELLEITVKRVPPSSPDVPPGLVSNWLHDNLMLGTRLTIKGPFGHFTCGRTPAPKLLLISAGSGITPMMSMARWLCDMALPVDIVFAYSARTPGDIVFAQELQLLDARHPNLKVVVTTTRSQPGQSWLGYQGRMDSPMVAAMAPDFGDRQVFVCGPNPFMAAVKSALENLKFPMDQYHEESFGGPSLKIAAPEQRKSEVEPKRDAPAVTPKSDPSESLTVTFTESNQTVTATEADSILDLAESIGVEIPNACRMGACGMCKKQLSQGEVNYATNPAALSEAEQAAGEWILPCVARPSCGAVMINA